MDIFDKIKQGAKIPDYQANRLRKDGTTVKVDVSLSSLYNESSGITGVLAITRVIQIENLKERPEPLLSFYAR